MKSFRSFDIFNESLNLTGIRTILSISYFSVLHCHGVSPWSISKAIIPIDQISFFTEYILFFKAYGDIYRGLPTLYLYLIDCARHFFANPKSAIFACPLLMSTFANFKSLCKNPLFAIYTYALTISLSILEASG